MADQTIALQLNIDTNAPDAIDQVKAKIAELEEQVGSATASTNDLVQAQQQLGQAKDLLGQLAQSQQDAAEAAAEAARSQQQHNESIAQGKAQFKEYRSELRGGMGNLLNLTRGTAEYNTELKKIGEHRADFELLRRDIAAVNPHEAAENMARFGDTGIKAMRGIGGAAALAAGSNEALEATIFKVEAVTETLQGVQGLVNIRRQASIMLITLETAAQELLNAVISSNPYIILIEALIAIGVALAIWTNQTKSSIETLKDQIVENDKLTESLKNSREAADASFQIDQKLAKARGESAKTLHEANQQHLRDEIERMRIEVSLQQDSLEKQRQINKEKLIDHVSYWGSVATVFQTGFGIWGNMDDKQKEKIEEHNKELKKAEDERVKAYNDTNNKLKELETSFLDDKNKQKDESDKAAKDTEKKRNDARNKRLEAQKKANAEELKEEEHQAKALEDAKADEAAWEKEQFDKDVATQQAEIRRLKDTGASKLEILNREMLLEIKQAKDDKQKLFEIDQKYEQSRLALQKESSDKAEEQEKEEADKRTAIRKAEFDTATSIGDAMASIGDLLLKKGKEQTDGTKAIALIQLGIKEAEAIANVVVNATDPANPANIATGGAAAIANIAAGIAGVAATFVQAKSILSSGSGSATAPSQSYNAPSLGTQFNGNVPTPNAAGTQDYQYGTNGKVFVSQTDLTAAQQLATIQNLNRRK